MKRALTIFLLLLFVLNIVGYYGLFVGLKLTSASALREKFDAEEPLENEVLIKVPIAIPYVNDASEYERVDGEFEHQGNVYRLVKQKLKSDTLYIVCIKDSQAQTMNQALADYVKTFTDKPENSKQSTKPITSFSKDYLSTTTAIETLSPGWNIFAKSQGTLLDLYQFDFNKSIVQPPEA